MAVASRAPNVAEIRPDPLPRLDRTRTLVLLAVWLLFSWAHATSPLDERRIYFGGDQVFLLQAAEDTLRGNPPLVGALSRQGLFHPGPLFVYLLAAVHAITGRHEAWSLAIVSLLQAGTIPLLGLLTFRLSRSFVLAVSLPFLFVFNFPFLIYLRFLWNVTIVTPALALALVLALETGPRRPWALPALAATLSLIAQAHMGFLPLAVWLGAATVVRLLLTERPIPVRRLAGTVAVLALVWAPVAWDSVRHQGGNLTKIVARFSAPTERHPVREVLASMDTLASESLAGGPAVRKALLLLPFPLLAIAGLRRVPESAGLRWFSLLLAGSWATFLWSVRTIPEPIQTYYLRPVCVLVAATVIGGAAALLSLTPARARVPASLLIAAFVVWASVRPALKMQRVFADAGWNAYPLGDFRQLMDDLASRVQGGRVRLEFQLADHDGAEPGFVYVLGKHGIERSWEPDLPAFRLTLLAGTSTPSSERWREVARSTLYRLEQLDPGPPAAR
ncbi:MAG: hypothetical protein ACHQPI_01450 [Thermoanaerobaculia bacterium]